MALGKVSDQKKVEHLDFTNRSEWDVNGGDENYCLD